MQLYFSLTIPLSCIFILITEDSSRASTYPPLMCLTAASLCCNHIIPTNFKEERPSSELIVTPLVLKFPYFYTGQMSMRVPSSRPWSLSLGRLIQYKNSFWSVLIISSDLRLCLQRCLFTSHFRSIILHP